MQKLVEQSEIDALCDELKTELALYNEHGYSQQNEAAFNDLKQRIAEMGDRLLCPCRG
ncbi:MAG: hypothetical protein ACXW1U_16460 [Methylobacter sp.]